ncbi:hypothetical protein Avbf_14953 [Armadillidium vulgare]|nr:hypothetical protein Avbf_14953 [Armadillidium vulgare]
MTKILDNCLTKLEELTVSQSERIDTVNTRKILDEIDEDLKKTDDVIYKRLQNGEKVFAVHKINEDFKYGEVSFFSNQLFFHCLSLSKVPKDSSLIWFEDVKQCLNSKDFCTFIKICCNEKNVTPFVIIETFDQCLCNEFIKLCTGECGPSYKGSFFKQGYKSIFLSDNITNVLSVEKWIENKSEKMRLKEYKRCLPKQESVSFNENEMLLYLNFINESSFLLVSSNLLRVTYLKELICDTQHTTDNAASTSLIPNKLQISLIDFHLTVQIVLSSQNIHTAVLNLCLCH